MDILLPGRPAPASGVRSPAFWRRWIVRCVLFGFACLAALVIGSCALVRIPSSGSRQTVLYYALPTDLRPGARLDVKELEDRLRRLGYKETEDAVALGEYRATSSSVEIGLRPFDYPDAPFAGGRVSVRARDGHVAETVAIDALSPEAFRLEPERIAGFEGTIGAVLAPLKLADAPPLLVPALLAVEDRRFYRHLGIDPIGTARALTSDLRHGKRAQGGSTLTQQLARSLFLHNKKTVLRKAQEAILALGLELRYSKDELLEAYLNAVYWGYWGTFEIRGVREAARYYLGKELEDVDAAGMALLIGLIQAPNAYSPYSNAEKATKRRDLVLSILADKGVLTPAEAEKARKQPIRAKKAPGRSADASYFLDAVRKEVTARASASLLEKPGTAIFTTLDTRDQAAAVSALRDGLAALEKRDRRLTRKKEPLQAAVVVIDPQNGEVRALVGGRDYARSPFNRAVDAKRQPGSLFKPFVYLTALLDRDRSDGGYWTPATLLDDSPFELRTGRKWWRPKNYDKQYMGAISLRYALEHSRNVPTARVAMEVGIPKVAQTARGLGVTSPLNEVPSLCLGTSDVSLLEITGAYASLAAWGEPHAPSVLRAIVSPDGGTVPLLPRYQAPGIEDRAAIYLLTRLLQGVMQSGTGANARNQGVEGPVAGKSGTTDDYKDAWFVGYSPKRSVGVWVGFDKKDVVGLSGSSAALPIWSGVMSLVEESGGDGGWKRPRGVVSVPIDPETGELGTVDCPLFVEEEFLAGTEPTESCSEHGMGILEGIRRLFRW